jgi:membrane associated rhomboid family serine protease
MLTHAFLHADWTHLIINMFVLYFFGSSVERFLGILKTQGYIDRPLIHFLLLFTGSVVVASLNTLRKHRDDPAYNSVGASGAVSAFIFTSIFFTPWEVLYLYFIPVPGILFGILYLVYSQVMSRRNRDNINHDAHFYGAVFGFIYPLLISPKLYILFFQQLFNP